MVEYSTILSDSAYFTALYLPLLFRDSTLPSRLMDSNNIPMLRRLNYLCFLNNVQANNIILTIPLHRPQTKRLLKALLITTVS